MTSQAKCAIPIFYRFRDTTWDAEQNRNLAQYFLPFTAGYRQDELQGEPNPSHKPLGGEVRFSPRIHVIVMIASLASRGTVARPDYSRR